MAKIQSIRGMNDILPQDTRLWQYIEATVAAVLKRYGYSEIRFPIVESTELFCRSIGEVTDIVEKEMYTFLDRNDESITLRPEGTAGCVRACEQNGLLFSQVQRLWYAGPMFRYEKPQKGRLRQFHQIGVESFGMEGPDIDAEIIALTASLWKQFGVLDSLQLELNSIGSLQSRQTYREALLAYLEQHKHDLDADSQRRLGSNPLRILDSKNPQTQQILVDAPLLLDFLDEESQQHFADLRQMLDQVGVSYKINPRLVRGLDYYGKTVFEWTTDKLGAQGTVCAGGRYDGLVEQLGGKPTPAIGFALGMERLSLLLNTLDCVPTRVTESDVDVYFVVLGEQAKQSALAVAETLRAALPERSIVMNCGSGGLKSQMKKADKSGAEFALILGEEEVKENKIVLKALRDQSIAQRTLSLEEVVSQLVE